MQNALTRNIIVIAILVVIGALAWVILTMPDQRTTGQKVGDAVDELPNVGKAAEQLENRTPGEKIGDAVKDATDNVPNN